jgi:hypothetical protein
VLDDQGNPQQVGPELVDADTADAIRTILAERAERHGTTGQRQGRSLLLHVAECAQCGRNLYHQARDTRSRYYCDAGARGAHVSVTISARSLEEHVTAEFLTRYGAMALMREVVSEARDLSREIRETADALDSLYAMAASVRNDRARARLTGQIDAQEARLANLEEQQREQAEERVRYVPTGQTLAQAWEQRDTDGRRDLLERFGVARLSVLRISGRVGHERPPAGPRDNQAFCPQCRERPLHR